MKSNPDGIEEKTQKKSLLRKKKRVYLIKTVHRNLLHLGDSSELSLKILKNEKNSKKRKKT